MYLVFKTVILFLIGLFGLKAFAQVDTLTNAKIISLHKAGVSIPIILKTISKATNTYFDLSSDELIKLKTNKVPDTIVLLMIERSTSIQAIKTNEIGKAPSNESKIISTNYVKTSLSELKGGACYIKENENRYLELSISDASFSSNSDGKKQNSASALIDLFALPQRLSTQGEAALVKTKNHSPVLYLKSDERLTGSAVATKVYFIKGTIKNGYRFFPFDTDIYAPKKNTYALAKVKLVNDHLIEVSLEKKLPPGTYLIYIDGWGLTIDWSSAKSGSYELDIE